MYQIFIILGYGVPKNIFKDQNYFNYLSRCFNYIYQKTVDYPDKKQILFFTGGNTDCFKPYKRKEAFEIKKRFFDFTKNNNKLKRLSKKWQVILESKALSTIENIWFARQNLNGHLKGSEIFIFTEFTRKDKVNKMAKLCFKDKQIKKIQIIAVDFDVSANRYLDKAIIVKKEKLGYEQAKEVIKDKDKYKIYRKHLEDKIKLLRKTSINNRDKALQKWWQENLIFKRRI